MPFSAQSVGVVATELLQREEEQLPGESQRGVAVDVYLEGVRVLLQHLDVRIICKPGGRSDGYPRTSTLPDQWGYATAGVGSPIRVS